MVLGLLFFGFIVIFFYPKPSSFRPTEFSIQQNIRQGMSQQDARMRARWLVKDCKCLGIEKEDKLTSYSTQSVCYGIVLECIMTK
jgi:hypothetical protein